jgi:hypothetical protein
MLEALVDNATGEVVLIREAGLPWGRKEGRDPDSTMSPVQIEDDDIERDLRPTQVRSWPYAEYRMVGTGEDVSRELVTRSKLRVPKAVREQPRTFTKDRRMVARTSIRKRDLINEEDMEDERRASSS